MTIKTKLTSSIQKFKMETSCCNLKCVEYSVNVNRYRIILALFTSENESRMLYITREINFSKHSFTK